MNRIVVQPGRTLRSGRRGRWFESSQSDQQTAQAVFFVSFSHTKKQTRTGDLGRGRETR